MGRSQQSFSKREREKKKQQKRKEKEEKRAERKENFEKPKSLDDMIAYVDEFGNITDEPQDLKKQLDIDPQSIQISVPKDDDIEVDPVKKGKVKFFNDEKGYGFIDDKNSNNSYFVHVNGLLDDIRENDKVTYELEKGPKGMMAVRVKKLS